jgi:type II secretory pathway component PulF
MADPLRATKVCDAIVVNMVDVGEETGDLDKMLIKVADNYDNDVDLRERIARHLRGEDVLPRHRRVSG